MPIIKFSDIVESNGKTIKDNNMGRQHTIPVDTLVEVKYDEWNGDGVCLKVHARLYVVAHNRDCDGTPLYSLSKWTSEAVHQIQKVFGRYAGDVKGGFGEESLHPVEVTEELKQGYDALKWEDNS